MRRQFWLLLPASFIVIVSLSAWLQPNPAGLGTHRALGLPECLFLKWTGLPCPSCGLTTSFALWMHGEWRHAFAVHPLGPLIFLAYALAAIFAGFEFFGRRTPIRKFTESRSPVWGYAALTIFLGTWVFRSIQTLAPLL